MIDVNYVTQRAMDIDPNGPIAGALMMISEDPVRGEFPMDSVMRGGLYMERWRAKAVDLMIGHALATSLLGVPG